MIPNLLSMFRLVVTPFVAAAITRGRFPLALALFFAAGITDMFDGYLARRFNWATRLGTYLDPAADKVLLVAAFLALGWVGAIPQFLVILVIGRDLLIVALCGAGYAAFGLTDFAPSLWGKISTIIQIGAAVIVLAGRAMPSPVFEALSLIAVAAATAGTGWSGIHYLWIAVKRWREARKLQLR